MANMKPLAWRPGYHDETCSIFQAYGIGGVYQVRVLNGVVWLDYPNGAKEQFDTEDAARDIANRDFQMIIEGLSEPDGAVAQLHAIVDAWEALPGGSQVRNRDVEAWLATHMGPGINAIRGFLRRPRPDGVLPPAPRPPGEEK